MDTAIFAIDKLYKAYVQCLRNKKDTANALKFELRREKGLYALLSDLRSRRYEVSRHIYFIVTKPSPREIFAADFRDRIVHHLLCNEIEGLFEKDFIECSYANRIGKGTHQAAKRLKFHLVRGGTNRRRLYFLKMDVKGFFRNIDRGILWEIIERKVQTCGGGGGDLRVWKSDVLWLAKKIVYNDPASNHVFKGKKETRGFIPREKSLLFAAKDKGLPYRQPDEPVLRQRLSKRAGPLHTGRARLREVREVRRRPRRPRRGPVSPARGLVELIGVFLRERLKLSLCADKTLLRPVSAGVDFLGYFIKPTHTLVRRKVVRRLKRRLYERRSDEDGFFDVGDVPMIRSYEGHFKHAHSFDLRRRLLGDEGISQA